MDGREAQILRDRILTEIEPAGRSAVEAIVRAASGGVYVAGGSVRDAMLGRRMADVDVVVEGDAIATTRRAFPAAKVTVHARFGTASVAVEGMRFDITTSRRETYARPGALPAVEPACIMDDLRRRDFSVNAMALRISGQADFIDPCGGADDLGKQQLRVLHAASFRDDATRIFRAIRYAARLDFELESATSRLLTDGLRYVDTLSGERVRREIELMFGEEVAGTTFEMANDLGALAAVHPALAWDLRLSSALTARPSRVPALPFAFALLVAAAGHEAAADGIIARLRLRRGEAEAVRGVASLKSVEAMLRRPGAKPSGVSLLLERYPVAAIAAFGLSSRDAIVRQLTLRYLGEWRYVKPTLRGSDLQSLGVPAGPQVSRGLQLIRAAKLDGWAPERRDEEALALRFAKSIRDSAAANAHVELHLNGD